MDKKNHKKKEKVIHVLKKAQKDKAFRKRLIDHPEATLKQEGLDVPPGMHVKFLEKQKDTYYYLLPSEHEELSEEDTMRMVGGAKQEALKGYHDCSSSCRGTS